MDWKAVASLAAPFAPTVGKILGGFIPFPGGALLGEWAGNALASALGVPATPEAVGGAIQADPAGAAAKLQAVENEAAARWDAMARIAEAEAEDRTAQSQAINETIRTEIATGMSWWHWRHAIGYVYLLWFLIPIPAFIRLTMTYNAEAVAQLTALIGACVPLYGFMSAVLGYVAQDTTKLKTAAITGEHPPSMTDNVAKAVKAVVGKTAPKTIVVKQPLGRD